MGHCVCLWILVLSLGGVSEASPGAQAGWDELVTRLRSVNAVSARTIPPGPVAGGFYHLSRTMIRVGTKDDFRKLLLDEQPIVRCAGLLALAQVQTQAAAPTIRMYLYDEGRINYCPDEHLTCTTTVGYFAWKLLLDANDLEHSGADVPLLAESEIWGLEIEFLAADSFLTARFDAARDLPRAMGDGLLVLELPFLRACARTLQDYQIIKAIGRLKPSGRQREFLIACLQDSTLDAAARLAAGSALTRHTDDISSQALRKECSSLNALDERRCGDQFIETRNARKVHETNMEPIVVERAWGRESIRRIFALLKMSHKEEPNDAVLLAKRTWQNLEEIKDRVVVACTCRHPLSLGDLLWNWDLPIVRADPDVHRAWVNSLIEISRNLKDYSQPWSTYADSASRLAMHIAGERQSEFPDARHLTDAECDEIEKNIAEGSRDKQGPAAEKPEPVTAGDGGT